MHKSLPAAFIRNVEKLRHAPFLYYKDNGQWQPVSWSQVGEIVKCMSVGLMALGIEKGDRICPISETHKEMVYMCLAVATCGAIFAPIYHTNSPSECAHVINNSGGRIAYADNQDQLSKLRSVWNQMLHLEKIVVGSLNEPETDSRILTLDQLIELGKQEISQNGDRAYYERIESIARDDLTAIIHTSGTTGPPKGVMLTNGGMIKNLEVLTDLFPVSSNSRGISVLPMAHQLELMNGHWYHILYGFPQYYADSIRTLYEDVRSAKPTFLFITPRFYEKVYNEVMGEIGNMPAWKKRLVDWCIAIGKKYQDQKYATQKSPWHLLLKCLNTMAYLFFFRKVHFKVGGKMEWSSTGSAPIPAEILHFFRACDFPIYEGYGLTESAGTVSMNMRGAVKCGTVGIPSKGLEVKFAEDGELLVKGWAQCAGYWENPEATKELFADGWLHTGDLGFLDEDGFLHLNGRKKEIIITSTGKNISPSNIQTHLKTSPFISEAVVFGEGRTFLTALITLDLENITDYAHKNGITCDNFEKLTQHPMIKDLIGREIESKNAELARIEQIRKFTILENQFSQEHDEVGPTMKAKRKVIETRYKDVIDAMYEG
jgi:long-chain acyl-CoA synthetase